MRQPPLRVPRSSGTWGSVSSTRTKRYWGTQRVARVCQVSPATVANWIDQGLLKGHKTPTGRRRVESDDLAAFLRAHGMGVPPDLERSAGREVVVVRSEEHTSELQSRLHLVCRLLLEKKKKTRVDIKAVTQTGRIADDAASP